MRRRPSACEKVRRMRTGFRAFDALCVRADVILAHCALKPRTRRAFDEMLGTLSTEGSPAQLVGPCQTASSVTHPPGTRSVGGIDADALYGPPHSRSGTSTRFTIRPIRGPGRRRALLSAPFEGRDAGALRDQPRWSVIQDFCLNIGAIGGPRRPSGEKDPPIAAFPKRDEARALQWDESLSASTPQPSKGGKP